MRTARTASGERSTQRRKSPDATARRYAAEVLGQIGDPAATNDRIVGPLAHVSAVFLAEAARTLWNPARRRRVV